MSRDVAYKNGYLPLYAGAELIRRSGALTQFPAENLIGTLPAPPAGFRYVYTAPAGLAGTPISRGLPNSKAQAIFDAAGYQSFWPITGYEPSGVITEQADYYRVRAQLLQPEGVLAYSFIPGTGSGQFNIIGTLGGPQTQINYVSTLSVNGRALLASGTYPAGQYDTMDAYLTACGFPPITVGETGIVDVSWELTWDTPVLGRTGFRAGITLSKVTDESTGFAGYWDAFFIPSVPYPAEKFGTTNSVQALFGGIDVLFNEIWSADDADLTEGGLSTKANLRAQSPDVPPTSFTTVSLPWRAKSSLTADEKTYLANVAGLDWTKLPDSNTITDRYVGMVGPTYINMVGSSYSSGRDASGVWGAVSTDDTPSAGALSVNLPGFVSPQNTLATLLTTTTAQIKAVLVPN